MNLQKRYTIIQCRNYRDIWSRVQSHDIKGIFLELNETQRNVLTHCLSRLEYDQIVDDMLDQGRTTEDDDMIATRRILRPPKKGSAAEIVGKRDRYRVDGSKIMKIYLDPKERNNTEYKLETFAGVYRKFCGKNEVFECPLSEAS
ncbi:small ribosomal subunit protein eS7-like [Cryptomeria japonica]|uniref:small ribosomal subunit protein eS7-like n=1 Tax=Cryptomeria japonica TaxID=3369 RepID=UPI0027DA538D|nr:small ribosomal subunit protein eS7-like [Cryptomeria japonica]